MSKITLEEIKTRLEANNTFKHYSSDVGITFEDFDIIDLQAEKFIKRGKKDIGEYSIMIKDDNKLTVSYDLTVESLYKIVHFT